MNIYINNDQEDLPINLLKVKLIANAVVALEGVSADELSINFVDTKTISQLHADYFDDPTTTDCISFPFEDNDEEYCVLGEIFVCPQTAIDYTKEHGGDPQEETALYIIHGILHLIGFDDIEEEDQKEMRRREQLHIANLKKRTKQPTSN